MRCLFAVLLSLPFALGSPARAEQGPLTVPLWERGAPGFENRKDEKEVHDRVSKETGEFRTTNIHNPYVTVFLPSPDKSTGTAVVIAPGGGHRELWVKHEGENVARWLSDRGIAAAVLRYRLGREKGSPYKIDVHALQDGQRAVRLVRSKAKDWNINPSHVGVMGFSAGGELTSMVCRHPSASDEKSDDPVDRQSAIPAFNALIYSGPLGIRGESVTKENASPTFMLVGDDDGAAAWLVQHYQDLKKAGVSSELHVFAKTPHGFGLRPSKSAGRPVAVWPDLFYGFLSAEGLLKKE